MKELHIKTLENTEGAIKNGQSRETGNMGYTRWRKAKQKHSTICVEHNSQDLLGIFSVWFILLCKNVLLIWMIIKRKVDYSFYIRSLEIWTTCTKITGYFFLIICESKFCFVI